jgi:hypothetical protein
VNSFFHHGGTENTERRERREEGEFKFDLKRRGAETQREERGEERANSKAVLELKFRGC